jgi:hypothetical protein
VVAVALALAVASSGVGPPPACGGVFPVVVVTVVCDGDVGSMAVPVDVFVSAPVVLVESDTVGEGGFESEESVDAFVVPVVFVVSASPGEVVD